MEQMKEKIKITLAALAGVLYFWGISVMFLIATGG